jgi:pimeloyl-ACP methyl ester carboxylesterase
LSKPGITLILDEPCAALHDRLAALAPVFVFKRRAGFLATRPVAAAEELHEALETANVAPPYVFVAASFGGFAALAYADRYPATLAGLVLVDSSHPDQGVAALAAIPGDELAMPEVATFAQYLRGFGPVWDEGCAEIRRITRLGDVPLIALAAGSPDMPAGLSEDTRRKLTHGWHELQRGHAALSTRGKLQIVSKSGHNIVATASEAIIAAVQEILSPQNT